VAVKVEWYEQGKVSCGDTIGLLIDGETYYYEARDAIARGDWYVIQPDGVWLPIHYDLPQMHAPFEGLSTVGKGWNVTRVQEEFERRAGR
jgi:hypothetical protein